jgi:hypothetical protein
MLDEAPQGVAEEDSERHAVSLLGDVEKAAADLRAVEDRHRAERATAVEALRTAIRVAHDEGIPLARIARSVGLSRERVRQLYAD